MGETYLNVEVLTNAKNLALLKLGRNVYNFGLVEQWLKYLVTISNVATKGASLDEVSIKKSNKTQKMMFGQLVGDILKIWHPDNQDKISEVVNLKEIRISTSFRIEMDLDGYEYYKISFEEMALDRNYLTHNFTKQYPLNTAENCSSAIVYLDNLREKHLATMNHLHEVVKTHRELIGELKEYLENW